MVDLEGDVGKAIVMCAFVKGQVVCVIYAVFSDVVGTGLGLGLSEGGEEEFEVTGKSFD